MPPKARGRGGTRGRGGRGGAAVASSEENASPDNTSIAPESSTQNVVPKQENDADDVKPSDNDSGTSTPQASSSAAETPNATAEPSTRPPVQRLGSLQGSVPPSTRSASPSVRGRGGTVRGKKAAIKPTFTGRRSKEERDALAKEAAAREKERNKEQDAAMKRKLREEESKKRRESNRLAKSRGGYSNVASGPFSLGSSREDRKNSSSRGGFSGFGGGSGSRATRVRDGEGGGGSGSGGPSIKREDGGYISSDDEDEDTVPRQDIDTIEISSDEEEVTPDVAPKHRHARTGLPVRIGRKEHQERTFGLNTEASADTKQPDAIEGTAQESKTAPESSRKGKGKAKDFEITGVKKPFRGVWQDPDESEVAVKAEPTSDDEALPDAEQIGLVEEPPASKAEAPSSPSTERKPKPRTKSNAAEPALQTEEDRAEWSRFQSNLQHIRAELGPEDTGAVDSAGDVPMTDADPNAPKKPSVRDNNVYLFQIPPLMPALAPPGIKSEGGAGDAPPSPTQTKIKSERQPSSSGPAPKIKPEEGVTNASFSDPSARTSTAPRFASGHVGKLRVHASGRTTLDWGGTAYELTPGTRASFLQEVVSVQVVPPAQRVVPEDAGEAVSFGRVKGKFVVVPDWGAMLG